MELFERVLQFYSRTKTPLKNKYQPDISFVNIKIDFLKSKFTAFHGQLGAYNLGPL